MPRSCGERRRLRHQAGLADPRLAAQHQRTPTVLNSVQERRQQLPLGVSTEEWPGIIAHRALHESDIVSGAQLWPVSGLLCRVRRPVGNPLPHDQSGDGRAASGARHIFDRNPR